MFTFTVSNGWLASKQISQERIMRIARSAHPRDSAETTGEDPTHMGPVDRFIDNAFCGGIKSSVLRSFYDISQQSALLKRELRKPDPEKNPTFIQRCRENILAAEQHLNTVISEKTVSVECNPSLTDADAGYLIIRDKNNLSPTGIALPDDRSDGTAIVPENLLSCLTPEQILLSDLDDIRSAGMLRCAGHLMLVKFTKNGEPVVLCNSTNPLQKCVQNKLTCLWLKNTVQEHFARLIRDRDNSTSLELNPVFLGLGTGDSPSIAERLAETEWSKFTDIIQSQFDTSFQRMEQPLVRQFMALTHTLSRLLQTEHYGPADDQAIMVCRLAMADLSVKLVKFNKNILRIKSELKALSHMISCCTEPLMIDIIKTRIMNFQHCVADFSLSPMGRNDVNAFNAILNRQYDFLRNFVPDGFAQCYRLMYPTDTARTQRHGIVPPSSRVHEKALIALLVDPTRPYAEVADTMLHMQQANRRLCRNKIMQKKLGMSLEKNLTLCILNEKGDLYQPGLDQDIGKSLYTPETCARIVTLLKMHKDLLGSDQIFEKSDLKKMNRVIQKHLRQILIEGERIMNQEHADFSIDSPELHAPKTADDGVQVDHETWLRHMEREAFLAKISIIRLKMREAREANMAALARLQTRAALVNRLSEKSERLAERTTAYKKRTTQFKKNIS